MKPTAKPLATRPNSAQTRAGRASGGPPPVRVTRLKTLDDVRLELSKVYREARTNKLPLDTAKGLGYLLTLVSALLKDTQLEQRISALEGAIRGSK